MDDKPFLEKHGYVFKSGFFKDSELNNILKIQDKLHTNNNKVISNIHNFTYPKYRM